MFGGVIRYRLSAELDARKVDFVDCERRGQFFSFITVFRDNRFCIVNACVGAFIVCVNHFGAFGKSRHGYRFFAAVVIESRIFKLNAVKFFKLFRGRCIRGASAARTSAAFVAAGNESHHRQNGNDNCYKE